ncbi:MAG: L,D-transpeptidase family protein [Lachnospiraceae bacterium]|nr:L,D-transpeptidase family protein [Lachnospiraceae bacterium]
MHRFRSEILILLMLLPVLILGTGCSDKTEGNEQPTEVTENREPEVVVLDMPGFAGTDVSEAEEAEKEEGTDEAGNAESVAAEDPVENEVAADQPETSNETETAKESETTEPEAEAETTKEPEAAEPQEYWFQDTKTAREHSQLIIVGDANGTSAPFTLYEKDENENWMLVFSVKSYIGRHGYNDNRHQGDETTPTGLYHFTRAFGIADDPGCTIGYTKVNEHHYWVGNSDSPYYNTMISDLDTSNFSKKSSEHLIAYTQPYQYCLNISFNTEQTPGRGSAIFLHCYSERPDTGGCVAIPQKYMKQLLCRLHTDCVIAIDCDVDDMNGDVQ